VQSVTNSNSDANSYGHCHRDSYRYRHRHSDGYSNSNRYSYADGDSSTHSDCSPDAWCSDGIEWNQCDCYQLHCELEHGYRCDWL